MTLNSMKHLTLALAVAAALTACKKDDAAAATTAAPPEAAKLSIDLAALPELPHFRAADLDPAAPVCQDLNAHVNGKWLAANPVPADKTTWGSFEMLGERSLEVKKQIIEASAK